MSRKAYLTEKQLHEYAEEPNLFWQAFEDQYLTMFKPLDSLMKDERIENWFVESEHTMKSLRKFVERPHGSIPHLLIVRGWTGSGKTTSIRVLFEKMRNTLPSHLVYLYLDTSIASVTVADLERDFDTQILVGLHWQFGPSHFQGVDPNNESDTANRKRLHQLVDEGKMIVIVWDNVDQCPRDIQTKCLQLAHHKLKWIPQQKIIVPVRNYTFARAQKELTITGYDYTSIRHSPPPMDGILRLRAGLARSAMERSFGGETTIDLGGGVAVTVAHGEAFLNKVLDDLSEQRIAQAREQLSNGSIRFQLDLARYALRSPYLTRELVLDALRRYFEDQEADHVLVPYHLFLEGILTGGMDQCYRIFSFEDALLINMFDAGEPGAYFNTLNRHHVADMVSRTNLGMRVDELISQLSALGHSRECTEATLREFLASGILWSEDGSAEDFPDRISRVLPTESVRYYLGEVMMSLAYLQHMGLVTPLEEQNQNRIEMWHVGHEKSTFLQRMRSAEALLRQIAMDESVERDVARRSGDGPTVLQTYEFGHVSGRIARSVLKEIAAIRRSSEMEQVGLAIPGGEWRAICETFERLRDRK